MGKYQKSYEDSITNEPALNKRAYNIIKNRIIFDKLHPGQQLSIASLAEELQVSRTPISVSLSALEREMVMLWYNRNGEHLSGSSLPLNWKSFLKPEHLLGNLL